MVVKISYRSGISGLLIFTTACKFFYIFGHYRVQIIINEEMMHDRSYFHWIDWSVFVGMLCVSPAVGIWHYFKGKGYNTEEYLLGSNTMKLLPVCFSLMTSGFTGVNLLGVSAEIYNFGTQLWIKVFSVAFAAMTVVTIYLPVFYRLGLKSAYQYLEIRFDKRVRTLISMMFLINAVLYESVSVYASSLALNQVTGIEIHLVASVICAAAVFCTFMGGIRAIVSLHTILITEVIVATMVITFLGTYEVGGPREVWKRAEEAKRIQFFNLDPSPYIRHSFWTVIIGIWINKTAFVAVNQSKVQRYQTLPTERKAKLSVCIYALGFIVLTTMVCWCGLVMLARWSPPNCDPRASGLVSADDQMFSAFVMEISGHLHGLPGLFVAGLLGGALSTLSTALNSTSVVWLEDFVKGYFGLKPNERYATIFVKSLTILLGLVVLALTFVIAHLGSVAAVSARITAVTSGISFGVFTLGMLFPWVNSKGAFAGAVAGYLSAGWASFGANYAIGNGYIRPKKLPVDLSSCVGINVTETFSKLFDYHEKEEDVFPLYRISYHLVGGLGVVVVILVGNLVSYFTGPREVASVKRNLLSPVIHRWLPVVDQDKDHYQELKQIFAEKEVAADPRDTDEFLNGGDKK